MQLTNWVNWHKYIDDLEFHENSKSSKFHLLISKDTYAICFERICIKIINASYFLPSFASFPKPSVFFTQTLPSFFWKNPTWLLFWKIFPATSRHRWDHSLVSSKVVRSKLMSSSGLDGAKIIGPRNAHVKISHRLTGGIVIPHFLSVPFCKHQALSTRNLLDIML